MKDNNISTLEVLEQRRAALQQEIRKSRQIIANRWERIFTPPEADTKVQHWVNQAERAVAIYDGFMMMYKLGQRFNSFSRLFKRKKKRK